MMEIVHHRFINMAKILGLHNTSIVPHNTTWTEEDCAWQQASFYVPQNQLSDWKKEKKKTKTKGKHNFVILFLFYFFTHGITCNIQWQSLISETQNAGCKT